MDEVHPIEARSYEILAQRVDLSRWQGGDRDVVARMIHATADESFASTARIGGRAVAAAVTALGNGAPLICDARMVVAGISGASARCYLPQAAPATPGRTRSANAIALAVDEHPDGAVWVIGNAPTALSELLHQYEQGRVQPAAVIGFPVGYVGAAESKAALWASALAEISITNRGRRGGSPVAAAAVNALLRMRSS